MTNLFEAVCVGITAGGVILGGVSWITNRTIDKRLSEFFITLNGTYIRSGNSDLTGAEINRRLTHIENNCVMHNAKAAQAHAHGGGHPGK